MFYMLAFLCYHNNGFELQVCYECLITLDIHQPQDLISRALALQDLKLQGLGTERPHFGATLNVMGKDPKQVGLKL